MTGRVGHVVDPDRVPDDPHDREQAEACAEHGGVERLPCRHRVHDQSDDQCDRQRREGGEVRLPLQATEQNEQGDQRQSGEDRAREQRSPDGVKHLLVHLGSSLGTLPACTRFALRPIHHVLQRHAVPGDGTGRCHAARAARARGRLPRGADVLRADAREHRVRRSRLCAGAAMGAGVRGIRRCGVALGLVRGLRA